MRCTGSQRMSLNLSLVVYRPPSNLTSNGFVSFFSGLRGAERAGVEPAKPREEFAIYKIAGLGRCPTSPRKDAGVRAGRFELPSSGYDPRVAIQSRPHRWRTFLQTVRLDRRAMTSGRMVLPKSYRPPCKRANKGTLHKWGVPSLFPGNRSGRTKSAVPRSGSVSLI